ncbi:MAG TPA: FAD-dependent oxidoreductase [Actinomycetes bacterium]|nr:FAD-dependent oxidoreductase [Actinomycetes bacterium]
MLDLMALDGTFAGQVLTEADGASYDQARAVFNGMYDRRPRVIARATNAADVAAAIAFGRRHDLRIAVRAGGHSVAGYSTVDDGLVIDLRPMNRIDVLPEPRIARVQAGVNWGELDAATQAHGLATTGGRMTTTGVAGFTLGSGSGWLERLHGLAADNLLSAQVVTAEGEVLTASETENPDLFWGLRGGGGNFGVVTEFEFQLHPVGPTIYAGLVMYLRDQAPEVLRAFRDFMDAAPREVCGGAVLMTAPPAPFIPSSLQGQPAVALLAAYIGSVQEGAKALAPLHELGTPAFDGLEPMPYLSFQAITDAGNPPGRRNYWRSGSLPSLPDDAIDSAIACASAVTSPNSVVVLGRAGGAITDVSEEATPLGGRAANWLYHCYGIWTDTDDDRHISWVRSTERALRPWVTDGMALNFFSAVDSDLVRRTFGSKYERLVAVKDRYDPDNVFAMNQNIVPSKDRAMSGAQ